MEDLIQIPYQKFSLYTYGKYYEDIWRSSKSEGKDFLITGKRTNV